MGKQSEPSPEDISRFDAPPRTLVELLRRRVSRGEDQRLYTFLSESGDESASLTYHSLERQARAIGARLQSLNGRGARALLIYPPGLEFIAAFFGCLFAGVIAIPAPAPNPKRLKRTLPRLQSIAADAGVTLGLTTGQHLGLLSELFSGVGDLQNINWLATDSTPVELAEKWAYPDIDADALAYLQYTSGSTGSPKGVMVTHANVLHNSEHIRRAWGYGPDSTAVAWIPYYHDDGLVHGIIQPLYSSCRSFLMSPLTFVQHPVRWLSAIANHRATHSGGPNFCYELSLRKVTPDARAALDLSSWRVAYNAAETVRDETLKRFAEAFAPCGFRRESFFPSYGLAEATLLVSTKRDALLPATCTVRVEDLERDQRVVELAAEGVQGKTLVGCGHPVGDTCIVIADSETGRKCAPDEVGEVWIKDKSVALGYWGRPVETSYTFQARLADNGEGPYLRTGDQGFVKNGELFITGRLKDMIIVRGQNHYPQDIEWTVEQSHPLLRPGCSAAFSVTSSNEEQLVIVAEVEQSSRIVKSPGQLAGAARTGEAAEYQDVIEAIRQAVAEGHELQPSAVTLLEAGTIPKTSSGKIRRHQCRNDFFGDGLALVTSWTHPRMSQAAEKGAEEESGRRAEQSAEIITQWLIRQLAERLGIQPSEIALRTPLTRYGLDSREAVSLAGDLETWLGRRLGPTFVYEYPTIEAMVGYLAGERTPAVVPVPLDARAPDSCREPIAIVGIGCRFPGASGPNHLWELLRSGRDAISEVPANRWSLAGLYDPDPRAPGKINTRWGGFLPRLDRFDPHFFGISPREASRIDPQQRLILEVAWEALEDAGQPADLLAGSRTGVFVGISTNEYGWLQLSDSTDLDAHWGTGHSVSIAANRLSYQLNLRGPSIAVDTACSSSLVAVHMACGSLWSGESALALAGGVSLILTPAYTINFTKAGVMAPDGRCKAFDARADGYVRGEGAGIVVLKPLSAALADGDSIYCVIRGSAVNSDGRTNGLIAPSREAQEDVLRQAYRCAGVSPGQVQYLEAHGTGTFLGDQIEAKALGAVLSDGREPGERCALGSVKTNIGHLEAAAGVAGLIKVALSLKHGEIPPSLHFQTPNPHIPFVDLPIQVQQKLTSWPHMDRPRLAGVSSFGFGGTNAHVVLESSPIAIEPRRTRQGAVDPDYFLLPLSAQHETALRELTEDYLKLLSGAAVGAEVATTTSLQEICYTASVRRTHHSHRLAVTGGSAEEIVERLKNHLLAGESSQGVHSGRHLPGRQPRIVFVFPGQGSQWLTMGRELRAVEPAFRKALEDCESAFREHVDWSLNEVLTATDSASSHESIDVIQPTLFAIQVALVALWKSWGIEPQAIVGQSMGEVAAAFVAGGLTLAQAAAVICSRSLLLRRVSGRGAMAAVDLPIEQARELISGYEGRLSIAVSNSPRSTVVAGHLGDLDEVLESLERQDVFCRKLKVDVASHSSQVDPLREELLRVLEGLQPQPVSLPFYSTVTGELAEEVLFDATYWWHNLREPVLFTSAVSRLIEADYDLFLEVSPHPILLSAIQQTAHHLGREVSLVSSMQRDGKERAAMLDSLARLYALGATVNWPQLHRSGGERCVKLPSYRWQHERVWFEAEGAWPHANEEWRTAHSSDNRWRPRADFNEGSARPLTGSEPLTLAGPALNVDEADSARSFRSTLEPDNPAHWLYEIEWRRQDKNPEIRESVPASRLSQGRWIIFSDQDVGPQLESLLGVDGANLVVALPGAEFRQIGPNRYQINPDSKEELGKLVANSGQLNGTVRGIIYLWGLLGAGNSSEPTTRPLSAAQRLGPIGLLHLTQALAAQRASDERDYVTTRLWVVTRSAVSVGEDEEPISLEGAPLWGMANTLRLEYPEFRCVSLDVRGVDVLDEARLLCRELSASDQEDRVALRGALRFVSRLVRCPPGSFEAGDSRGEVSELQAEDSCRLRIATPGMLDTLELQSVPDCVPGPEQIKIQVHAAGLNFVDVLRALNVIPPPTGEVSWLGGECAGTVVAVGEDVTAFKEGDRVVAIAPGCFSTSCVCTDASLAVTKPASLSFEEASTIPVAYLTAYYSLVELGRLQKGERVLIHAAAGGVGLAAVNIARRIGAEIFATAGTQEKREYLHSIGIEHVLDSRTLSFADEVLELTGGEGVDVVLNSLAGEAIPKGLKALRDYGRFVEIGKRDIADDSQIGLRPFRKNLSFFAVDLYRMMYDRRETVSRLFREVMRNVSAGLWAPLPLRTFPLAEATGAFRTMAQGGHTGKIVFANANQANGHSAVRHTFSAAASYVITGGNGGLALALARWMVSRGARHLALISRRGAAGSVKDLEELTSRGAQLKLIKADVTRREEVSCALAEIRTALPPLRGVVHAAGILDDGLLSQLTAERFDAVMAPKVLGAWNLHSQTLDDQLDFFILYSSAAAILGSPGQANYGSANAFLDALAHYRRASGLPALSIAWGPWDEVGLASRPDRAGRLERKGMMSLTQQQAGRALDLVWHARASHLAVIRADWHQWQRSYTEVDWSHLLSDLVSDNGSGRAAKGDRGNGRGQTIETLDRQTLLSLPVVPRRQRLEEYLKQRVCAVLGIVPASFEESIPLSSLGLDSLTAVELRHRFERDLEVSVPIVKFFKGATLSHLSESVLCGLAEGDDPEVAWAASGRNASDDIHRATTDGLAELERLTDRELDSLLTTLLNQNKVD